MLIIDNRIQKHTQWIYVKELFYTITTEYEWMFKEFLSKIAFIFLYGFSIIVWILILKWKSCNEWLYRWSDTLLAFTSWTRILIIVNMLKQ